jgi:hypothetical protein
MAFLIYYNIKLLIGNDDTYTARDKHTTPLADEKLPKSAAVKSVMSAIHCGHVRHMIYVDTPEHAVHRHLLHMPNATAGPSSFPGCLSWRINGRYLSSSAWEFLILSLQQSLMTLAAIDCKSEHALNPDLMGRFALTFFLNVPFITHH